MVRRWSLIGHFLILYYPTHSQEYKACESPDYIQWASNREAGKAPESADADRRQPGR
jgi:hypothetical protein